MQNREIKVALNLNNKHRKIAVYQLDEKNRKDIDQEYKR